MLTRKIKVAVVIVVLVLMGMAGWAGVSKSYASNKRALFGVKDTDTELAYKSDEIIVKFKKAAANTLEEQLSKGKAVGALRLSTSLDNLSRKYKVKELEPVIKNFKAKRQRIENLPKKDKHLLTKKEKHLLKRLKRAPKGAKVPDLGRIYVVKLESGQSAPEAAAEYNEDPGVEYAELNYIFSIYSTEPNDPNYSIQWALDNRGQMYPASGKYKEPPGTPDCDIDANEAWDISTGSGDVWVAVIDSGVDYYHRDLIHNIWMNTEEKPGDWNEDGRPGVANVDDDGDGLIDEDSNDCEPNDPNYTNDLVNDDDENGYNDDIYGYDFCTCLQTRDSDPQDEKGHGTHCAGIIAADSNNGLDITGVSWNAKIMAIKFLNLLGNGLTDDAFDAIMYAVDNGADVLSNSWGGYDYSQSLKDAINYAHSQGVITVASAGNTWTSDPNHYPGNYEHVISVAATDSNDDKAIFSNYGDFVDIAAPGVDILSLRANGTSMGSVQNDYTTVASGTSMACPHVAGACALLLSIDPTLGPNDVNEIIMTTADELDDPNICASGRLNLHKAALEAIPSKGHIDLEEDYYNCDCNIGIFLADYDLEGQGTQDVNITTSGGDLETLTLTEIEPNIGVFTGTISTAPGDVNTQDGILQVSHGATITVTYLDADDGTGNPASPNDTATADCVFPVISNLDFDANPIGPNPVIVSFDTNEHAFVRVLYGESCGGSYKSSTLSLGFNHTVKLEEVPQWTQWTDYYFIVEATDLAGNETVDSNDSNCYHFITDGPRDLNVPGDFNTIQEAIDHSWDGGTVWVAAGTYYETIDFKGKAITVTSTEPSDWDVVEATIIDANEENEAVSLVSGEDVNSVLKGFTVRNASNSGVYVELSSPTISNCALYSNFIGVDCRYSSAIIENNKIMENSIGICCYITAKPVIKNNWICNNNNCGIVVILATDESKIVNNTITGSNSGVLVIDTAPTISNCIVWDCNDDLYGCDANYSCIEDGNSGTGNISSNPCFVNADSNDFHLEPNSPCINAGDPNGDYSGETDIDGDLRIMRGRVDMGADEVRRVLNITQDEWYVYIQDAIDNADDDDTLIVYPGTYYETIDFDGNAIAVRSSDANDWGLIEATVIDANGDARAVDIDTNSVLSGFTITGGTYGVYCDSASPTVSKCIIEDNSSAGVYCNGGSPKIENSEICDNDDYGVHCNASGATIKNNWIYHNDNTGLRFEGTTGSAPLVRNNTIAYNTKKGIWCFVDATSPTVSNCIIWENNKDLAGCNTTYSCIQDNDSGTGNIHDDPVFADADSNDFHLEPDSPCIDAGNPDGTHTGELDIDFEARVIDGDGDGNSVVDMGADETDYPIAYWKMDDSADNPWVAGLNGVPTERVKNGTFEDDSEWVWGTGWEWVFTGIAHWQPAVGYNPLSQVIGSASGERWVVFFEVLRGPGDIDLDVKIGGAVFGTVTEKGKNYVFTGTAGGGNNYLQFVPISGTGVKIDNVSGICLDDFPLTGIFYDDVNYYTSDHSVAGKINEALEFDGINDYVDCGNDSSLDITGPVTICAWLDPNKDSAYQGIVTKCNGGGSTNNPYEFRLSNDVPPKLQIVRADSSSSDTATSTGTVSLGDGWHHAAVTVDSGGNVAFYIDGQPSGTATLTVTSPQGNNKSCLVANRDDGLFFEGKIDDVIISDRVLSLGEIQQLYQDGLGE